MTSVYPGAIDAFNNPGPTTKRNAVGYEHDQQHANVNDAVEAIEAELGTDPAGSYATVKARLDAADYNASLTSSYWKFKTGTSDTDPGAGQFTMNNTAKASATYLYLDTLTGGGTDVSNFMSLLAANDKVFVQDQNDASKRVRYNITGAAVDGTGYWKIPVSSESAAGGEISNNDDCLVLWTIGALGASSGGATPYTIDQTALHGTYGDDFNTGSLNARWTRRNIVSGDETFHDGTWLTVNLNSGNVQQQYHQAAPSGDFTIVWSGSTWTNTANIMIGPMIIDSAGAGVCFSLYDSPVAAYMWVMSGYVHSVSGTSITSHFNKQYGGERIWYALNKTGTNYKGRYSYDGCNWSPWTADQAWAGTVDRIGFGRIYGSPSTNIMNIDRFNVV